MSLARGLRLVLLQARASALVTLQYRLDVVLEALLAVAWIGVPLVPLLLVFREREDLAGWSWSEALVVVGFFTMLKGVISLVFQPSLLAVVEHVRKGTMDFLLLKPVSALLLVSTARFHWSSLSDVVAGLILALWGASRAGASPGPAGIAAAIVLFALACTVMWALHVLAVSMAFHFVKIDNLAHLILSTFDAGRWPASVYRGGFAFVFTFVFPLALMTTWPALALLGRPETAHLLAGAGLTAVFVALARASWGLALRRYTSAGG